MIMKRKCMPWPAKLTEKSKHSSVWFEIIWLYHSCKAALSHRTEILVQIMLILGKIKKILESYDLSQFVMQSKFKSSLE